MMVRGEGGDEGDEMLKYMLGLVGFVLPTACWYTSDFYWDTPAEILPYVIWGFLGGFVVGAPESYVGRFLPGIFWGFALFVWGMRVSRQRLARRGG